MSRGSCPTDSGDPDEVENNNPDATTHFSKIRVGGTVLYCTVLFCTVLYCIVLYCTVLYCTVLYMQDSRFTLWCLPAIISLDRALLGRTTVERDSAEFGKYPVITGFENNSVAVRRGDGSLVVTGVSPYPAILHGYAASHHWEDATKLCRFVKDPVLWACLAGMAVHAKHLDTAEVAYAAIQEADKVHYIQVSRYYNLLSSNILPTAYLSSIFQYIKELPLKEARSAEMSVMTGHYQDAENTLLQSGLVFRAIVLNIYLHQVKIFLQHIKYFPTIRMF